MPVGSKAEEMRWNFNLEDRSPFGFRKNAEIWNGRVAQVSFLWVFLQELIQGKGMLQGIKDGDLPNTVAVGSFSVLLGLLGTRFLMEEIGDTQTVSSSSSSTSPPQQQQQQPPGDEHGGEEKRQWNFNSNGRSPYGLRKNAEIWNGRIAQVRTCT
jgi:hypothetical protein